MFDPSAQRTNRHVVQEGRPTPWNWEKWAEWPTTREVLHNKPITRCRSPGPSLIVTDSQAKGVDSVRVLITGANGFLGRSVVAEFLRRGESVRALVRPATRLDALGRPEGVEVIRGDLRVSRDLTAAFEGVDALVHLAAAVTGGEDAQFAATVVGTERLLDAMARSRTRRLVLVSSFSVYDWSRSGGN